MGTICYATPGNESLYRLDAVPVTASLIRQILLGVLVIGLGVLSFKFWSDARSANQLASDLLAKNSALAQNVKEAENIISSLQVTRKIQPESPIVSKSIKARKERPIANAIIKVAPKDLPPCSDGTTRLVEPLELKLTLARGNDGQLRGYLDGGNTTPTELQLQVDPKAFSKPWYARIGIGVDVLAYPSQSLALRAQYDVTDKWSVGPGMTLDAYGNKSYGLSIGLRPFN